MLTHDRLPCTVKTIGEFHGTAFGLGSEVVGVNHLDVLRFDNFSHAFSYQTVSFLG